jgi:phospholipid-translocating ATPase
MRVGDIIKVH